MRTRLSAITGFLGLLFCALPWCGCSGGGGVAPTGGAGPQSPGGIGQVAMRIHWPTTRTREIPSDTQAILVSLDPPGDVFPTQSRWLTRPTEATAQQAMTIFFVGVPSGAARIVVRAYSTTERATAEANEAEWLRAKGQAQVQVQAGETAQAAVYLVPRALAAVPVAYSDGVNGTRQIFVMDATGGTGVCVTADIAGGCTDPTLTPDGQRVAFVNQGRLWMRAAALEAPAATPLTLAGLGASAPAWSPSGSMIACLLAESTVSQVAVVDVRAFTTRVGEDTLPLLTRVPAIPGSPRAVAWAGASQLLVVTTYLGADRLVRVSLADATQDTLITAPSGSLASPSWNATTGDIAYLELGSLKVITESGAPALSGFDSLTGIQSLTWLPDGTRLAMCWTSGGDTAIHLYRRWEQPVRVGYVNEGAQDISFTPTVEDDGTVVIDVF
jgi:hypothetical protein